MKFFLRKEDAFSYIKENQESLGLYGTLLFVEPLDANEEKRYWVTEFYKEVTERMESSVKHTEPELEVTRYEVWEFISMAQWDEGMREFKEVYESYELAFPDENVPLMKKERKLSTYQKMKFLLNP